MAVGGINNAIHMMNEMRSDMARTISLISAINGLPVKGRMNDVPLLIKALTLRDKEVRREARETLIKLAGEDLGKRPGPWNAWWAERGKAEMAEVEVKEDVAGQFEALKSAVIAGDSKGILDLMSDALRMDPVDTAEWLEENRKDLRRAFRDAQVQDVNVTGDVANVTIRWGRSGYKACVFAMSRTDSEWRFTVRPWGDELVEMPPPEIRQNRSVGPVRIRKRKIDGGTVIVLFLGAAFLIIICAAAAKAGEAAGMFATFAWMIGGAGAITWLMMFVGRHRRKHTRLKKREARLAD